MSEAAATDTKVSPRSKLILAAMIFAVAMTFIDQTIVAIAIPDIQSDLHLSSTGAQWIINGYLLALAAMFAAGGKIADIAGHKSMVIVGTIVFAASSALVSAAPDGSAAEAWMITFRVIQGVGAAIMFPAALAIVVGSFPLQQRGRALAIFFAVAGGLTAIGPLVGGYLTEWTWRSIFWINIPIAIIAIVLTIKANPSQEKRPQPFDFRGAILIVAGMGLAVLGLQQASVWGWGSADTLICIIAGVVILALFAVYELRVQHPLVDVRSFKIRAFAAQNVVLFVLMIVFIPLFFFESMYAQISLGADASDAGSYILAFFGGFVVASQWGGKILDTRGAKPAVVLGGAVAAVGFFFFAGSLDKLDFGDQWYWLVMAGAGVGLMLGPSNTDAINRLPKSRYGEASGVTQTVRNFGASIGMAVLGTILLMSFQNNVQASLEKGGVAPQRAESVAHAVTHSGGSGGFTSAQQKRESSGQEERLIGESIQKDFADASETVFYAMSGVMVFAFLVALIGLPAGRQTEVVEDDKAPPVAGSV